jgi:hypothetical protein
VWKAILGTWTGTSSGCKNWKYLTPYMSTYPMRAQIVARTKTVTSATKDMRVYGHIAGSTFWENLTDRNCPGTVSNDVHTYLYFTAWGIGCWFTNTLTFDSPTTCRQLVLVMMSTDNSRGDASSSGVSNITITQQTVNTQGATFDDNVVTSASFNLDGTRAEVTASNTMENGIYFLDSSYADCLTPSGT